MVKMSEREHDERMLLALQQAKDKLVASKDFGPLQKVKVDWYVRGFAAALGIPDQGE